MKPALLLAFVCGVIVGPANAQNVPTGDGRMLTVPLAPAACERKNLQLGVPLTTLTFDCPVKEIDQSNGRAAVEVVIVDAAALTDDVKGSLEPAHLLKEYMQSAGRSGVVEDPSWDGGAHKTVVGNGEVTLRCVAYDNVDALTGHAMCVLPAIPTQLVMYSDASMAFTAMRAIEVVMKDARLP